jgi:hypothetical protein
MSRKPPSLSESVRVRMIASGLARSAISRASGVAEAVLCRWVKGTGSMSLRSLDALAEVLKIVAVQRGKPSALKPGRTGRPRKRKR